MEYPGDAFHTFLDLDSVILGSQWDSHKPPGSQPKYLKLCSEDEQSFYGLVKNDKIIILGWSIPLSKIFKQRVNQI